jgi:hypothetical protein
MIPGRFAPYRRLVALVVLLAVPAFGSSTSAADTVLYRIFLRDGSTVVSYGEFARVADRVVFSMPIASTENGPQELQLVSVAESTVDWGRTDQYVEAVRAKRYADTRGEADFSQLSADVARTLSDVSLAKDPKQRLAIAGRARQMLAEWPARNYGYRAKDVAQLSGLLDDVLSELRAAAGESRIELSLVAETSPPPPVALIAAPTFRESIEQALTVARVTPESTERVSLLESIVRALQPARTEAWAAALHARAAADLTAELRTEIAYTELATRTMASAEQRARVADVKGLEKLIQSVLQADDKLGRRRPQATGALLATLDMRLANARRLRLERDAWTARLNTLRAYQRSVDSSMERFRESIDDLQEIKALAGPSSRALGRLSDRTAKSLEQLGRMRPSADLQTVHGMLTSAFQMAGQAATARHNAIRTTSMDAAWRASSAAAGALLMFERANEELQRLAAPPTL